MTTPSPIEVYHVYTAQLWNDYTHDFEDLDVEDIVVSQDIDRVDYCEATIILASVTPDQWVSMDPREDASVPYYSRQVTFQIQQYDVDDNLLGQVPPVDVFPGFNTAKLYIRTVERDRITGRVTMRLAGGESFLAERRRLSGAGVDTGATTVGELVTYSLFDTFGAAVTSYDGIVNSTAIPAGDRRMFNPGESHIDLIRPELDAINCRLYDVWGNVWRAMVRGTSGDTIKLATFTQQDTSESWPSGAPADVDGIVSSITETVSRDGDWADGVLIKYDNTDNGGTVSWSRSSAGVNTRGLYLTFNRAAPAGGDTPAEDMETRTRRRGADYIIEARCRLDVVPGRPLDIYLRNAPDGAEIINDLTIRSVEWRPREGTMTVRAQTGDPIS